MSVRLLSQSYHVKTVKDILKMLSPPLDIILFLSRRQTCDILASSLSTAAFNAIDVGYKISQISTNKWSISLGNGAESNT